MQSLPLSAATLNAALGSPLAGAAAGGGPALPGAGLLVAKLVATSGCVASGLVGGTFAPSLLLGASLGVVYHQVELLFSSLLFSSLLFSSSLGVVYHRVQDTPWTLSSQTPPTHLPDTSQTPHTDTSLKVVVPCPQAAARALALLASAVPALAGATSVANAPTFAMVGGAAFLSSVFGAPLTSALLLLEVATLVTACSL